MRPDELEFRPENAHVVNHSGMTVLVAAKTILLRLFARMDGVWYWSFYRAGAEESGICREIHRAQPQ
jgi:hypothetical protein